MSWYETFLEVAKFAPVGQSRRQVGVDQKSHDAGAARTG